jgi:hypothetical protein
MRFSLKQTSARAFELSLPDKEGRTRQLGFEHITELGGAVEITPHAIELQEAAARLLQLTAAEWRTPSGLITIGAPVAIMDVFVDGRLPRGDARSLPLDGRVKVKRLGTDGLVLEGFMPRLACGVRVERLDVTQHAPAGTAVLESLAVTELETAIGDFLVRLGEASASGVQARWPVRGPGESADAASAGAAGGVEVTAASITGTGLAARSRGLEIEAENIAVQNAAMRGRALSLAAVSVSKVSLELDLAALAAREQDDDVDATSPEAAPARPSIRSLIDWRFLDRVDGQIDVDVTVDAHLPVIRRRRATHYFRVPIEKGIFNYRQLESGLSSLENAVIDFDLQGHKLVIERDLPIIRMRKNLVEWHLDDEEMALAKQRKIKLRTLPRFVIKSGNGKSGDVKLHGVEIHPINIDLSISPAISPAIAPVVSPSASASAASDALATAPAGEGGEASSSGGAAARPGQAVPSGQGYAGILPELTLRRLTVTGSLDYPEGEGSLAVKIRQLAAMLRGLPLGNAVVDIGAIRIDSIDPVKIVFDGLRPRAIALTIHGLVLERVTITRAAAEAAATAAPPEPDARPAERAPAPDTAPPAAVEAGDGAPVDADAQ